MIRMQDVRMVEKDKVKLFNCFRPGDIVKAKIISLGDARSYYLSTAENSLGVIWAESEAGGELRCVTHFFNTYPPLFQCTSSLIPSALLTVLSALPNSSRLFGPN
jgi:hypothetical protein